MTPFDTGSVNVFVRVTQMLLLLDWSSQFTVTFTDSLNVRKDVKFFCQVVERSWYTATTGAAPPRGV